MSRWIKLKLHDRHPKITALAQRLDVTNEKALALSVRWFRWIDECISTSATKLIKAQIDDAVEHPGFALAIAEKPLQWIVQSRDGHTYKVHEWRNWFGEAEHVREQNRVRKQRQRERERSADVTRDRHDRAEQSKSRADKMYETEYSMHAGAPSAGNAGSAGDGEKMRWKLKAFELIDKYGIVGPNAKYVRERLNEMENPFGFLQGVLDNARVAHVKVENLAGYIYRSVKSEAQQSLERDQKAQATHQQEQEYT